MVERKNHCRILDLHRFINRSACLNTRHLVGTAQRHVSQSLSDIGLILRMYILDFIRLHQVIGRNHTTVRYQSLSLELSLSQQCTADGFSGIERSYLYKIERQFAQSPFLAPQRHHRLQPFRIRLVLAHVRLSLIPQKALDGIILQRLQHSVIHQNRTQVMPPVVSVLLADVTLQINVRILRYDFTGKPSLHRGSTPAAVDDSHRNIQYPVHHPCKMKSRGTECRSIFRIAHFPATPTVIHRLQLPILFDGSHTDSLPFRSSGNGLIRPFNRTIPESP